MSKFKKVFCVAVITIAIRQGMAAQGAPGQPVSANEFIGLLHVAQAATDARRWPDAARAWELVVEVNPVNEEYWQQLAAAHYKSGEFKQAVSAFEKALNLGGYCFPSETSYNIARSYAAMGDKENAVAWLQDAFARGYRDIDHIKNDTSLKLLSDDPRFIEIVGRVDGGEISRDQRWQSDLAILKRELERKSYPQFVKMSKEELESQVATLSKNVSSLSDLQATVEVMKRVTRMGVGHTEILPPHTLEFAETMPMKFVLFKEGLFVIAADPKYENLLGAQVLSIGNATADQAMEAVAPVVDRDNDMWLKAMIPNLLRYSALLQALNLVSDPLRVPLTIRDLQGQTRNVVINADPSQPDIWNSFPFPNGWVGFSAAGAGPTPLYLRNMETFYSFQYLPDSRTVYFQFNRVLPDPNEPFGKFVARLFAFIEEHDVDRLIIDMRWNNGGNTYLLPPLIDGLMRTPKINREGGLFVIIGRRTFSAAGNAAAYIQRQTNAIFVGEPTGAKPNSMGDETYFTLPNTKLSTSVADVYWESSWPQDFRNWIAPQIYVEPTFSAFRTNHDSTLDAILELDHNMNGISQHPGFGCKAERRMDEDENQDGSALPAAPRPNSP